MLGGLLYFLVGVLVLVFVLYGTRLLLSRTGLASDIQTFVLAGVGILGLVVLLYLAFGALRGPVVLP